MVISFCLFCLHTKTETRVVKSKYDVDEYNNFDFVPHKYDKHYGTLNNNEQSDEDEDIIIYQTPKKYKGNKNYIT